MSEVFTTRELEDEAFLRSRSALVDKYIDLRVRGYGSRAAMSQAFGTDNVEDIYARSRIDALEGSSYYQSNFKQRLKDVSINEILNDRLALHEYMSVYRSDARDSTRLAALKEACVLAGITVIDEKGNSTKRPTLEDFYRDHGKLPPLPPGVTIAGPAPAQTTH